jgi:hypothetical protein
MSGRLGTRSPRPARCNRVRLLLIAAAGALLTAQATTAQGPVNSDAPADASPQVMGLKNGVLINPDDPTSSVFTTDATGRPAWVPPVPSESSAVAGTPGVTTALGINAIFDSSITSDANAAAIQNTINTAIAIYQSTFTDPITVTIRFLKGGGLGSSSTYYQNLSYGTYLATLKADAKSSDDATANSHLPSVATNPVNGSSTINVKTANLRAVGIPVNPPPGEPDSYISVNTALTSPGSPGTTGQYDLLVVVEHEIDEALGLGSTLPTISNSTIFPEDLYRYNQNGSRSFTASTAATAFFSIDGVTDLAEFNNQISNADFGDWRSGPLPLGTAPKVQDAVGTVGAHPTLGVELITLDVIGFDRAVTSPSITSQPQSQSIASGQTASLSVTASGVALSYQWYTGTTGNTASPIGGATASTYTTPALTSTTRYWVRVSNAGGSANSNTATIAIAFTDSTLTSGSSVIRLVHVTELRTRINAIRAARGLQPYSYANPTLTAGSSVIKAIDITELRTALAQAYTAAGMTVPTYTYPTLTAGVSIVRAIDMTELRNAVVAIE